MPGSDLPPEIPGEAQLVLAAEQVSEIAANVMGKQAVEGLQVGGGPVEELVSFPQGRGMRFVHKEVVEAVAVDIVQVTFTEKIEDGDDGEQFGEFFKHVKQTVDFLEGGRFLTHRL